MGQAKANFAKNNDFDLLKKIGKTLAYHKISLVEKKIVEIIKDLQSKNIKIIALTKVLTKPNIIIPHMGLFRFLQLNGLDINFSSSFSFEKLNLDKMPEHNNSYPEFYKGILMTNYLDKGFVLFSFFKNINWEPKKIIFFDNDMQNITSVEKYSNNFKIDYIGYHYIYCELNPQPIDNQKLKKQIDHLLKTGDWIEV